MVCASLTYDGAELLHPRRGLETYRNTGSSMGIPILYPWANRLGGSCYAVAGREVAIAPGAAGVRRDEHGLPIHGLLAASDRWEVHEATTTTLRARLDFGAQRDLLASFPWAHTIVIDVTLAPDRLRFETTVTARDEPVPIAYGYHPYLIAHDDWRVELPAMRHRPVDTRGIPTGAGRDVAPEAFRLGDRTFDDGYDRVAPGAVFALIGGGRRVEVVLEEGYPAAQLFSPPGSGFLCFEPMAAPTNALGEGTAPLAREHRGAWSLRVRAA